MQTVQMLLKTTAGFIMHYRKFKDLCNEAWKEKCKYLKIIRLDVEEQNCVCNESQKFYEVFISVTGLL